jgi:hypothetical protein
MSDTDSRPLRRGGCQCGDVRYELSGPTLKLVVCHCTECRKQSASAFGVSVFVAREALRLVHGSPRFWSRPTDSGNVLECAYCPGCGSRLWHQRSGTSETISVKGGSLDDPVDLSHAVHIWTSRKLAGVVIPDGATRFERGPDE